MRAIPPSLIPGQQPLSERLKSSGLARETRGAASAVALFGASDTRRVASNGDVLALQRLVGNDVVKLLLGPRPGPGVAAMRTSSVSVQRWTGSSAETLAGLAGQTAKALTTFDTLEELSEWLYDLYHEDFAYRFEGEGVPEEHEFGADDLPDAPAGFEKHSNDTYVYYVRGQSEETASVGTATEPNQRIAVNMQPRKDAVRAVLTEVLAKVPALPFVNQFKLNATAALVGMTYDNLIIYFHDGPGGANLALLQPMLSAIPDEHLRQEHPALMEPVAGRQSIAVAFHRSGESLGKWFAGILAGAVWPLQPEAPKDDGAEQQRLAFRTSLLEAMRKALAANRIDPNRPHQRLPEV